MSSHQQAKWAEYKIKDIGRVVTGSTPSMKNPENYGNFISWATAIDFKSKYIESTRIKLSEIGSTKARRVPKGAVLVTCIASIGLNAIAQVDLTTNQQINAIIVNMESFDNEFVYYLLCHESGKLRKIAGKTAVPIINKKSFEEYRIYSPSLVDQKRISAVLSQWDQAVEKLDRLIEAKQKLRKALMEKLLTGQIRFPGFGKSVANPGIIPDSWHRNHLGNVADVIMGVSPSSSSYNTSGIGLPLIQGNDDIIDEETRPKRWTSDITKECQIDDVVMSVRAPVGEIAMSKHHACIGRGVCAIRPKSVDRRYLYYLLTYHSKHFDSLGQGSTFTCLTKEDIRAIYITIPQIEEQRYIGQIFDSLDNQIRKLYQTKQLTNKQKRGLMNLFFD